MSDAKKTYNTGPGHVAETYVTGKPCKRGHYGPRYKRGGNCVQCYREKRGTKSVPEQSARLKATGPTYLGRECRTCRDLPLYVPNNPACPESLRYTSTGKCVACAERTERETAMLVAERKRQLDERMARVEQRRLASLELVRQNEEKMREKAKQEGWW